MFAVTPTLAQNVTPEEDYENLVKVSQSIEPLGEHPLGAQIDLFSGNLSFSQIDVALPGTGPTIAVTRHFSIKGPTMEDAAKDGAFADWDLALPRIETLVQNRTSAPGAGEWRVNSLSPYARCSDFARPDTVPGIQGNQYWSPPDWWKGYHMVIPGVGSEVLMNRDSGNFWHPAPMEIEGEPQDVTFDIVTKSKWAVGCLQNVDNAPGEGFVAVSPNGTKYWFDHMVKRWAPSLFRPPGSQSIPLVAAEDPSPPADVVTTGPDILDRLKAMLLVTKIEDRFGNQLNFTYDITHPEQLKTIESDDGRKVTFAWDTEADGSSEPDRMFIQSVTVTGGVDTRVWNYDYQAVEFHPGIVELISVTRPDSSMWEFGLTEFLTHAHAQLNTSIAGCDAVQTVSAAAWTAYIDAPSGLHGEFAVATDARSRAQVDRECWGPGNVNLTGFAVAPYMSYPLAITSRTLSGAGIDVEGDGHWIWLYRYSDPHPSWAGQSPPSGYSCTGAECNTRWIDVSDPEGNVTRATFSTLWGPTEGHLLGRTVCTGACGVASPHILHKSVYDYAAWNAGLWPDHLGFTLQNTRTNTDAATSATPRNRRDINQYYYAEDTSPDLDVTDTYTWQATSFNGYAQATATSRYNDADSDPAALLETQSWRNDTTQWVLGLPRVHTNLNTGDEVSEYVYDFADNTLERRETFGREAMTYDFDTLGRLLWFEDARDHRTSLSQYKLGIPQRVDYANPAPISMGAADLAYSTVTVDDFGQIRSATDEEGDTTQYDYDDMGRLRHVIYPVDSSQPGGWAEKFIDYSFGEHLDNTTPGDGDAEVLGEYWRRTVSMGDLQVVTHYDALLRPILETTSDQNIAYGMGQSNIRTDYDAMGRVTFKSYPVPGYEVNRLDITLGVTTVHDALGRQVQIDANAQYGNPATISTYSDYLAGNKISVTDPRTHTTTTTYQAFDAPAYEAATRIAFADGTDTTIPRNAYGNPISMTQTGQYTGYQQRSVTHTFEYDDFQQLCLQTSPETGQSAFGYFDNGLPAWSAQGLSGYSGCIAEASIPPSVKVSRKYDERDRLDAIDYPSGTPDTDYDYYDDGKIKSASRVVEIDDLVPEIISKWTLSWLNRGLLDDETLTIDGHSFSLGYDYDSNGHLASTTYSKMASLVARTRGQTASSAAVRTTVSSTTTNWIGLSR